MNKFQKDWKEDSEQVTLVREKELQPWLPDVVTITFDKKYFDETNVVEQIKKIKDFSEERTIWKNELKEEEPVFFISKEETSVSHSNEMLDQEIKIIDSSENNEKTKTNVLKEKVLSNLDKAFSNEEINKFLKCVENKDFSKLVTNFQKLKISKDLNNIINTCDNLEETFNITRLGIEDTLQKIKIEDYQKEMFHIRKITNELKNNPDNKNLQNKLNSIFDNMIRKLESRKALKELLKELDTNEEELESELNETKTVF